MREILEASWGTTPGKVSIWHRQNPGKGEPVDRQRWFRNPEDIDKVVGYVESIKDKDVYLAVAVYAQESRTPAAALTVSSIWCDADTCDPSNFRLEPSRIVRSSNGNGDRWQCWWDLNEPMEAKEASELARIIAFAHKDEGADQSSWPANKLMRIPGTVNTNWSDEPFVVEETVTGIVYFDMDIYGAYDDVKIEDVKKYEPIVVTEVDMSEFGDIDILELLDRVSPTQTRLNDLIYKTPKAGPDGWRSEHRWALIGDLLRAGFTEMETLAIAWSRPAASKWREDPANRGIEGLMGEVKKLHKQIELEEKGIGVPAPEPKAIRKIKPVTLLTDLERKIFEARETFDVDYLEWARRKVTVFNAPLHETNIWLVMSAALSPAGYVPAKKGAGRPLNFYIYQISESSSGKSEAKDIAWSVIRKLYPGDSPDIGGDHSPNNFIEQLLLREDKPSIIHADEAHGLLAAVSQGGWNTGIMEKWTNVYDGWIPQQGRVGRSELQKPDARGIPIMHMMGTPSGMFNVLHRDLFLSGYLARQIWAIGESFPVTRESLREEQAEGDVETEYEGMPKYWSNRFAMLRQKMISDLPIGKKDRPMLMTREALDRMTDMKMAMKDHFDQLRDTEVFTPISRRTSDNVRKAATLIAMSRGKTFVSTYDLIIAMGYAEKWIGAVQLVAEQISDTFFSKQLDQIEKFISSRESGEAAVQQIYIQRKEPKRVTDEFLLNLMSQGRIEEVKGDRGGPVKYRVKTYKKGSLS